MLANGPEFWDLGHFPKELQLRQMPLKYPRLSGGIGPHPQVGLGRVLLPTEVGHHPHGAMESLGDEVGQYGRQGRRRQQPRPERQRVQAALHSGCPVPPSSLEGWLVFRQDHYH